MYIGFKTPDGVWRNTLLNLSWHTAVILRQHIANTSHESHTIFLVEYKVDTEQCIVYNAPWFLSVPVQSALRPAENIRKKDGGKHSVGCPPARFHSTPNTIPAVVFRSGLCAANCYNAGRGRFQRAWRNACHCPAAIDCPTL